MTRCACSAFATLFALALLAGCGTETSRTAAPPEEPPSPATRAALGPDAEGLVEVNGTELFVKRVGAGDPVIVVHGGPVLEHGYLLPWLEPLADEFELIFYDQRLSGRSAGAAPPESVRLETFADDIEAIRVALGLGRIHLLAHSWGGLIAQQYAIHHADQLRSLVLLDSMAASSELWQAEQAAQGAAITTEARQELNAFMQSEAFQAREPEAIATVLRMSFRNQFVDPGAAETLVLFVPEDYTSRSDQFGAMMVDLEAFDLHAELAEVSVPALVLYGAAEPGAQIGGPELAAALADARLELIDDAGHFPFIEQPAAFLAVVRSFLSEVGE